MQKKISLTSNAEFHINRFAEAPDNGLVGYGYVYDSNPDHQKSLLVIRLDSSLNLLWAKEIEINFPMPPKQFYLQAIHCDGEGRIFCSFQYINGGIQPKKHFFVALNADGGLIWSNAITDYYGPHIDFRINGATSVGDKVLFMASSRNDTIINFKKVPRPGFTGLSFNKNTGTLIRSEKSFIPYITSFAGIFYSNTSNKQLELYPNNGYFSYAFLEAYSTPLITEFNLISFVLDTAFTAYKVKKLRGKVAGAQLGYAFNKDGGIAVLGMARATIFAALDDANNLLISKSIGTDIFPEPNIVQIDFPDNEHISMSVTDKALSKLVQVNIPLHSTVANQSCLGKDTSFFTIEPVTLVKQAMPLTVYRDVVNVLDVGVYQADHTFQTQEICKVKSSCSSLKISGGTSFCLGAVATFKAKKNIGCLKQVAWNIDTSVIKIRSKTDSSITLQFTTGWKGFIKANLYGCSVSDSLFVSVHQALPSVSLGEDRILCVNESTVIAARDGYKKYLWNTGHITPSIKVNRPGKYYLQTEDYCGNKSNDTVLINASEEKFRIGKDTAICVGDSVLLEKNERFSKYSWKPTNTLQW